MMIMEMKKTSWQERYHASEIYTLRCKVHDTPGMLGKLITAIGQTRTHLGDISTIGIESHSKIRDIQVYCSNRETHCRVAKAVAQAYIGVNDD